MFSWLLNHTPERRKGIKPRRCRPWPPSASTFGAVAFRDLSITEILIRKSNKSHSDLQKIRCLIVRIYSLIRGSGHAIFTFKSTFYFPLVGHCPFCFFFRTSLCLAQLALLSTYSTTSFAFTLPCQSIHMPHPAVRGVGHPSGILIYETVRSKPCLDKL